MNPVLHIILIIAVITFNVIIIYYLAKNKLNLKYSLVWLAAGAGMFILSVFPDIVTVMGTLIGIATPVNTVFLFAGMFMILIIFTLTIIVSHMNNRIYRMVQEQALLEKRVRELEHKLDLDSGDKNT